MDAFTVLDVIAAAYAAVGLLALLIAAAVGRCAKSKRDALEQQVRALTDDLEAAERETEEVSGANGRLSATISAYRTVLTEHLTATLRHEDPTVRLLAASLLSELDFARLNIGPEVRVAPVRAEQP